MAIAGKINIIKDRVWVHENLKDYSFKFCILITRYQKTKTCKTGEMALLPSQDCRLSWNWVNEHVCVWWCHPTGHNHGGNGLWAAPGAEEAEAGGDASGGRTVRPIWLSLIHAFRLVLQDFPTNCLGKQKVFKKSVLHKGLICCCSHRGPAVRGGIVAAI